MKKTIKKILSVLLVFIIAFTFLIESVSANELTVYTTEDFIAAVENGGTVYASGVFSLSQAINITKDTNIILNPGTHIELDNQWYVTDQFDGFDSMFIVDNASLTIDIAENQGSTILYKGMGSAFKLIGGENAEDYTSVIILGGSITADAYYDHNISETVFPSSVFNCVANGDGVIDVSIYGGYVSCQTQDYSYGGSLFSGEGYNTCIKGGRYSIDPTNITENGYVAIKEWDSWFVTELSYDYGTEFSAILNDDRTLSVKRVKPEDNGEAMIPFIEELYYKYTEVEGNPIVFYNETYNLEEGSMYASLINANGGEVLETHKIIFSFEYDDEIKQIVDGIVSKMPEAEGEDEHYYFTVSDLELINYWLTCYEYYDPEIDEYFFDDNIEDLINYSGEFKQFIDYKNFKLDPRMGDGDFFYTMVGGFAEFKYRDTVYAVKPIGAKAEHIIYVSDETGDTPQELMAAAQERIDGYIGAGKVTLAIADAVEGIDETFFETTINGMYHTLLIRKDSSKMVTPQFLNVDVASAVIVASTDASIPLDTMISVDNTTGSDEQQKLLYALNVDDGETYDIKLNSGSLDRNITKLENGKFTVALPIPERLNGKKLKVYYMDDKGVITEYNVIANEGFAIFETDHFSEYTLAASTENNNDINKDGLLNICDLVEFSDVIDNACEYDAFYDLDKNGTVDFTDFEFLRTQLLNK